MTIAAFERAFATRNAEQEPYQYPTSGPAVWQLVGQQIQDKAQQIEGGLVQHSFNTGVVPPSSVPTGQGVSLSPPQPGRATQAPFVLPPPEPAPSVGSAPLALDSNAVDRALSSVDTGPTLEDFTRTGTVRGFGDPNLDPYGVALRKRLTALLRSAG